MKTIINILVTMAAGMCVVSSCGGGSSSKGEFTGSSTPLSKTFADAPVAAQTVAVGSDSMIVGKLSSVPEPVTLRASDILDDVELVKLESSDEATVGQGFVWVTYKRILIYSDGVVKQFDRSGKYLGKVGAKGNGPGEYTIAPYYMDVDEKAGRIYLMQYGAKDISVYNTSGEYIESIPLAQEVNKGFFTIDNEKGTVTVAALLFHSDENPTPVWTQDMQGNVISSVFKPDITVVPDFSSEIHVGSHEKPDGFTYSLFRIDCKADTLYEYADGRFTPAFTFDFGEEVPMHYFRAFPQFFVVVTYGAPERAGERSFVLPHNTPFVIDRSTLRGAPAVVMFDNLGTLTMDSGWADGSRPDYLVWNIDPGDLLDCLEAAPESHPLATDEGMARMKELKESIAPDDNNYLLIGRWKH